LVGLLEALPQSMRLDRAAAMGYDLTGISTREPLGNRGLSTNRDQKALVLP
jgi:hypothetical protein